ncbi:MAG: tetratricopeptide repeat protein [Cyanobacteria bacterium TGS_CYA1]|nr:tetratricopeptide repeat protein [Cyanobacteria bacterium TGS_CYA1]
MKLKLILMLLFLAQPAFAQESQLDLDTSKFPEWMIRPAKYKADQQVYAEWEKVQCSGAKAFEAFEYGKAERLLKEAVNMAQEIGPGDIRIAKSPGDLGRLLEVRGRFDEAEPYLEQELYLKERAIGRDYPQLIPSMEDLIRFYLVNGTRDKAGPLTEDLINFVQGKYREQAKQAEETKLKKGSPLIGWAGTAQMEMRGPLLDWSITCDKLGDTYRYIGKPDMAEKLYKTALDVKATVLGKRHLSLANSYDNLGRVSMTKGELKDAESYYLESLSISQEVLEKNDPALFGRMDRLAKCYIEQKKFAQAEAVYKQAIAMFGGNKDYLQRALFSLGCMYSDQRRYGSASAMLGRALSLARETNGNYSIQIVPYLRRYAYVAYYTGGKGRMQNLHAQANYIAPEVKSLQANAAVAGKFKVK